MVLLKALFMSLFQDTLKQCMVQLKALSMSLFQDTLKRHMVQLKALFVSVSGYPKGVHGTANGPVHVSVSGYPKACMVQLKALSMSLFQDTLKRRMVQLKARIEETTSAVEEERSKNVNLLHLIFPPVVAKQLWKGTAPAHS